MKKGGIACMEEKDAREYASDETREG